jgi:hypothetical protein
MATRRSRGQPWGEPFNLSPANSSANEYNSTLSSDELVLIFSRGPLGGSGSGGRDLYMASRSSRDNPFSEAANLGPIVNSSEDEDGPFLFDDASAIWLDSRRPGGYGGADMWVTRRVRKQTTQRSIQLPDADAPGLLGILTVDNRNSQTAFHYFPGKVLPNGLISEQLVRLNFQLSQLPNSEGGTQLLANSHLADGVTIRFRGQLEVPHDMVVDVIHNGGSPTNGVNTLLVDGREIGQVGDDRMKRAVYHLTLEAGIHDVDWVITGGHFEDCALQFFDSVTKQPMSLRIGARALAAVAGTEINQLVTNEQFAAAPLPADVRKQE